MRMKNPAHAGEVVADALADLRITKADAAKPLGVSRAHFHAVLGGRVRVRRRNGGQARKGLGLTAVTWLAMQAAYDLARVKPVKVARLKKAA
jgi:antitoxin HigA-1